MPASLMQMASPRPPMPPVTSAIRCVIVVSSFFASNGLPLRPLLHVAPRRRLDGLVLRIAQLAPRRDLAPAMLRHPLRPEGPPAARMLRGTREPLIRIRPHGRSRRITLGPDPVAAAVLRGRIDGAGDVTGRAQHEFRVAAE